MTQDLPSPERRWNHNTHFHARVLDAVPDGANTALDVGTGNGLLARDLYGARLNVAAIDLDADVLSTARRPHGTRWRPGGRRTRDAHPAA